jgi:hypothetical protein
MNKAKKISSFRIVGVTGVFNMCTINVIENGLKNNLNRKINVKEK